MENNWGCTLMERKLETKDMAGISLVEDVLNIMVSLAKVFRTSSSNTMLS